MYCHKCGKEGKEGSRYCDSCGTLLGDLTERNKKFCHNCGTKLHQGSDEEVAKVERKLTHIMGLQALGVMGVILVVVGILPMFLPMGAQVKLPSFTSTTTRTTSITTTSLSTTTTIPQTFNPVGGTSFTYGIEYSSNTILKGDVATTGSILIDHGVTVTTDGYSMIAGNTFRNQGVVNAGNPGDHAGLGEEGQSYTFSFGGSGGAGGGGGEGYGENGTNGWAFNMSNALIAKLYEVGMTSYLTGGGGGGGCQHSGYGANGGSTQVGGGIFKNMHSGGGCGGSGGAGGSGSYGVFIQANTLIAGKINANGQKGVVGNPDVGGGGGGGAILLAYGNGGYIAGTYDVSGGAAQGNGGAGGRGQVITYPFDSVPPITQP